MSTLRFLFVAAMALYIFTSLSYLRTWMNRVNELHGVHSISYFDWKVPTLIDSLDLKFYSICLVLNYVWRMSVLKRQYTVTNEHRGGVLRNGDFGSGGLWWRGNDEEPPSPRFVYTRTNRCADLFLRMNQSSCELIICLLSFMCRFDRLIWNGTQYVLSLIPIENESICSLVSLVISLVGLQMISLLFSAMINIEDPPACRSVSRAELLFLRQLRAVMVRFPAFRLLNPLIGIANTVHRRIKALLGSIQKVQRFLMLLFSGKMKISWRTLIFGAMILIMEIVGRHTILYLWASVCVVSVAWPYLMLHWNGFTPLPADEDYLRERITTVANLCSFFSPRVYVGDLYHEVIVCGSSRCIFLSRKLVQEHPVDEVVAAIAHQLVMWKFDFGVYSFIAYQGYIFLQLFSYLCVKASSSFFRDLGFDGPLPVGLVVGVFLRLHLCCVEGLAALVYNLFTRYFIYKADSYVSRLGRGRDAVFYTRGLQSYLTVLEGTGQIYWPTDHMYSTCFFSTPTVPERITYLRRDEEAVYEMRRIRMTTV